MSHRHPGREDFIFFAEISICIKTNKKNEPHISAHELHTPTCTFTLVLSHHTQTPTLDQEIMSGVLVTLFIVVMMSVMCNQKYSHHKGTVEFMRISVTYSVKQITPLLVLVLFSLNMKLLDAFKGATKDEHNRCPSHMHISF